MRNWAGNVTFAATHCHRPTSVPELRELVAGSERIRPLGTRHSFNRLADSPGVLVSLADLPAQFDLDRAHDQVTVGAGVRYGELAVRLHAEGYALGNLASLPHISVAGAVSTGTHGSGDRVGNLATSVAAVELVTADGELVTVRRETDPDRFAGMVVGLGAFGVVSRLTLDLVPTFQIRQDVYENLPREALAEAFADGYSVSLFTDWRGPLINQVWRKRRVEAGDDRPAARRWLGATLADGPRHPVPGMPTENCTPQLGRVGPWHERLPHFRLEFTPSSGDELQSEYLVPRSVALPALAALDAVRDRLAPVLQVSELRTVAADDLWLSPSYRRDSLAIHFTWIGDPVAVLPVIAEVERQLAPFAPRPHWGKLFGTAPSELAAGYARFADFVALVHRTDPTGKFRNELLEQWFPGGADSTLG